MAPTRDSETERTALLAEIARLEQAIASLSDAAIATAAAAAPRPLKRVRSEQDLHRDGDQPDQDIQDTLRALLTANDSALLAAHPPVAKDYDNTELNTLELERAYELIQANARFTGIEFSSTESHLQSVEATHQTRVHTLVGTLPSSTTPVGFRVTLTVREPTLPPLVPEQRDPGTDYVVDELSADVWGGGAELQRAVEGLDLRNRPNPPALFSLLRQYSLLASQRTESLGRLAGRFSAIFVREGGVGDPRDRKGKGRASGQGSSQDAEASDAQVDALTFSNPTGTLALRLAIPLVASPDGMLSPTPSLTPIIDSSLRNSVPPTSLAVLEDVPRRFQLMLADGFDLERAVEALVQAVFGEV